VGAEALHAHGRLDPGGDGRHERVLAHGKLLSTTANVVIENFSSPGARMTDVGFFPGMTHDGMCVQQVHGFFHMQGLIITLGTNDWGGGVDGTTFLNAYLALLDSIPAGIPVVCVTPIWRSDEATPNPTSGLVLNNIRFVAAAACALRGFPFIDGSALVPHDRLYYSEPSTAVRPPSERPRAHADGPQTCARS
jgi:hypothetical protein